MPAPFPRGVFPALPTPLTDGVVDAAKAAGQAHWFVDRGAHGLIVAGSGGEFIALTIDERKVLAEAVLAEVGLDVPVIVCIGAYGTRGDDRSRPPRRGQRRDCGPFHSAVLHAAHTGVRPSLLLRGPERRGRYR